MPADLGHERRRADSQLLRASLQSAASDSAMVLLAIAGFSLVSPAGTEAPPIEWSLLFGVALAAALMLRGAYSPRLRNELLDTLPRLLVAVALAAMATISLSALILEDGSVGRGVAELALCALGLMVAGRLALAYAVSRGLLHGDLRRRTLILGAGKVGNLTARRLLSARDLGLQPIGFLDDDPLELTGEAPVLPVLGGPPDLDRIVAEHQVEHFIVGFSMASHQLMLGLVRRCWELGVSVSLVPRLFEVEGDRAVVDRLGGLPIVSLSAPETRGVGLAVKYGVDRVLAALVLLFLLPVLVPIAIAIRLSMGGPIFFAQHRIGRDGRHFAMWKFRTMTGTVEESGEADARWAAEMLAHRSERGFPRQEEVSDDRCTPLGRFLRRLSLDELPQLWNILLGQMSFIGPRPERVHYVEKFEEVIYRYGDRHRVKSGITGWAQVNGLRGETSLQDRVEWDNYYIENWSLWLDLKIMLKTVGHVLRNAVGESKRSRTRRPKPVPSPTEEVG